MVSGMGALKIRRRTLPCFNSKVQGAKASVAKMQQLMDFLHCGLVVDFAATIRRNYKLRNVLTGVAWFCVEARFC
jgi:hypothetical protein